MNIKLWLATQWVKLPEGWRFHIESAVHTFAAAFLTQACIDIASNGYVIPLEKAALISLLASAIRAAWKAMLTLVIGWWMKRKQTAASR